MKSTRWTGAAGDQSWFDAGNWSSGVPGPFVATSFSGGSFGTISLAPSAGKHAVSGAVTITHAKLGLTGGRLRIDPATGQTQDLTVTASSLGIDATAGLTGAGTFTFGNGAQVLDAGTLADGTGLLLGNHARLAIDGAGARWTSSQSVYVGSQDGSALLLVESGGHVSATQTLDIGGGSALISGKGSVLSTSNLEVGNSSGGLLTIQDGATVTASFASTVGDGTLSVVDLTGPGSTWNAASLLIGDGQLQQCAVLASNGATLNVPFGTGLLGTLALDGTVRADFGASGIVLEGGTILAEAPPGHPSGPAVTIRAPIQLFGGSASEPLFANLASIPGTRLVLTGQFTEGAVLSSNVAITGGDVVLTNATNQITEIRIDAGMLDLAATGAGGGTLIAFSEDQGTLRLEAGVSVPEQISGFQFSGQLIDFAGIAAGAHTGYTYTPNSAGGGTLTVSDGTHSTALVLTDFHNGADFFLGSDNKGGTTIYYQGPTQP